MAKEYDASDVQEVLENHSWPYTYTEYEYGYVDGQYQRIGDGVERTVTHEFSWDDIYGGEEFDTSLGKITVVEADTGGEGHGEDISIVIKTEETGQLFRINGRYMSHYGSEWDGQLFVVNAVERTVVFYE